MQEPLVTGRPRHDPVLEALAVAVRVKMPVLLWGSPGTGKSSALLRLGERLGLHTEVVIASIREPADFAGLPVLDRGVVRLAPPSWAMSLVEAGGGLLFLDEISTTPPAVQSALLRVCLERVVGDVQLPPETAIVAAANPPGEAGAGWDLVPPLANRFVHLPWEVSASAFAAGMSGRWPEAPAVELTGCFDAEFKGARELVGRFVLLRPDLVCQVPSELLSGRGWPSPRSWEGAARLLAASNVAGVSDRARRLLVEGCVGEGPAVEFFAWLEDLDLFDPEEFLRNPDTAELPERADRRFAVLKAVVQAAVEVGDAQSWHQAWRVLERAVDGTPDVAGVLARDLARARPEDASIPRAVVERFLPLLRSAGLA